MKISLIFVKIPDLVSSSLISRENEESFYFTTKFSPGAWRQEWRWTRSPGESLKVKKCSCASQVQCKVVPYIHMCTTVQYILPKYIVSALSKYLKNYLYLIDEIVQISVGSEPTDWIF